MKAWVVTFVVQADNHNDAKAQARAYLTQWGPTEKPVGMLVMRPQFSVLQAPLREDMPIAAMPHLDMTACKTCGKRLIDNGWVRFCSEECDDGSQ